MSNGAFPRLLRKARRGGGRRGGEGGGGGPYDLGDRCPAKSSKELLANAQIAGGLPMVAFTEQAIKRVGLWKAGEKRPINPATDEALHKKGFLLSSDQISDGLSLFVALPVMGLSKNRTKIMSEFAATNCWEAAPFHNGPMIFRYSQVRPRLTDPKQARGYYTATAKQTEVFFDRDLLLFQDGKRHSYVRKLLEKAGFARQYPVDLDLVAEVDTSGVDDGKQIGPDVAVIATIPVLFKALLGVAPPTDISDALVAHAKKAPPTIFGTAIDRLLSPAGVSSQILAGRKLYTEWGKSTPWMKSYFAAAGPGSPELKNKTKSALNIMDAATFAGLLGTSTMVQYCVNFQRKDPAHRAMFERDPERYLVELMRFDSAVTSVTEKFRTDTKVTIMGKHITFAKDTPQQLAIASANRDPTHWHNPNSFDPNRADLGDTLSWNGAAHDVENRDFKKAPRHCPGYCLSLKVGAAICSKIVGNFGKLSREKKVGGPIKCSVFGASRLTRPRKISSGERGKSNSSRSVRSSGNGRRSKT